MYMCVYIYMYLLIGFPSMSIPTMVVYCTMYPKTLCQILRPQYHGPKLQLASSG